MLQRKLIMFCVCWLFVLQRSISLSRSLIHSLTLRLIFSHDDIDIDCHFQYHACIYFPKGPQPYDINSCGMVQYCFLGCMVDWPFREPMRELGCSANDVELSVVTLDSCR